jgi:hypothetical protein
VSQRVQIIHNRDAAAPSLQLAEGRRRHDAALASRSLAAAISGAALAGAILAAPGPAAASSLSYGNVSGLIADVGVGGCGGSVGCGESKEKKIAPATNADTAAIADSDTRFGGQNTSNASAVSNFASQHAYAEAFASYTGSYYGSYAETSAVSDTYEVIDGAANFGGPVTATFNISGSETPTSGIYGASDGLYFQFTVYDMTTGALIKNYIYESFYSFAGPVTLAISYDATAGDKLGIESDFEASAYVSSIDYDSGGNHLNVIADFSHTLTYTLVGAAGTGHIVGESGHDYFYNPAAAAPEPSTWALALIGFLGVALTGFIQGRRPLKAWAALGLVGSLGFGASAQGATLFGSAVSLIEETPDEVLVETQLAGPVVEFNFPGHVPAFETDVTSDQIIFQPLAGFYFDTSSFDGFVLVFSGAPAFTDVTRDSSSVFPSAPISFTSDEVSFDLSGLLVVPEYRLVLDVAFAPSAPAASAPEPSTWALMLAGFAGLAFAGAGARVRRRPIYR